jgi:hypothetical protein
VSGQRYSTWSCFASQTQHKASFERELRNLAQHPVSAEDVAAAIGFLIDTPSVTPMIALDSGQHLAWSTGER